MDDERLERSYSRAKGVMKYEMNKIVTTPVEAQREKNEGNVDLKNDHRTSEGRKEIDGKKK